MEKNYSTCETSRTVAVAISIVVASIKPRVPNKFDGEIYRSGAIWKIAL